MRDFFSKFRAPSEAPVPAVPRLFAEMNGTPISESSELRRVLALPERGRPEGLEAGAENLSKVLSKGAVKCQCREKFHRRCPDKLLPTQAWALMEAANVGGIIGAIGVGEGKTLLDLLVAMVVPNCKKALLLIPPELRRQLLDVDWEFYGQHWHLPNLVGSRFAYPDRPWLHVMAYSELSGAKATDALEQIRPDLVIADEAHFLRRRQSVRTKRFFRYMSAHNEARLCAWSGTMTKKSLKDYAPLCGLALGEGSPAPLPYPVTEQWAAAIDPVDWPAPPGALIRMVRHGETLRTAWRRRFQSTPGVISSPEKGTCDASIAFHERPTEAPRAVDDAIKLLDSTWQRPDGEELVTAIDKARCARELACGFFYRWTWPRGESDEVIARWLEVRKAWHKELREKLKFSRPHLDSPLLCVRAAIRYREKYDGLLPIWNSHMWPEWEAVRDSAKPETETVWISDWLVHDAANWLAEAPGVAWYESDAFGRALAKLSGVPFYGPGEDASAGILRESGKRSIIASIRSHGTGKNLQMFNRFLVVQPPSDGATWDQLVGRAHRQGQEADEVTVGVYRHTPEMRSALDKARELSAYMQDTMGGEKKLLLASYGF